MYRGKDRQTAPLFPELFPFGGKLDPENRWLKISRILPWEEMESRYMRFFSDTGRPSKDGRLVIGILLLKHMKGVSRPLIFRIFLSASCMHDAHEKISEIRGSTHD